MKFAVLGCGYVANQYLSIPERYPNLELIGCADLDAARATKQAKHFATRAMSVPELLESDAELIVNLTPHEVHSTTTLQMLEAGKHVYTEKPIALTMPEARQIQVLSQAKGLRVGCAPDTFLGATWQGVRQALDAGRIGRVVNVQLMLFSRGPEFSVPNSNAYYQPHGLLFDLPAYPITNMVALFGSVRAVTAVGYQNPEPRYGADGQPIPVNAPTHYTCVLEFADSMPITLTISMDVPTTHMTPGEIHGTHGSLALPMLFRWADLAWIKTINPKRYNPQPNGQLPLPTPWWRQYKRWYLPQLLTGWQPLTPPKNAFTTRGCGVFDLAQSIAMGCPHRASLELGVHVLEVTLAIQCSITLGQRILIETQVERPKPVGA